MSTITISSVYTHTSNSAYAISLYSVCTVHLQMIIFLYRKPVLATRPLFLLCEVLKERRQYKDLSQYYIKMIADVRNA